MPLLLFGAPEELAVGDGGLLALSILAVVQGLTEFLPVSSSGHLVLAQAALGFEGANLAVDVAMHVGTLLSVLLVYRRDLVTLVRNALGGDLREPLLLGVGTLPAVVVGLFLEDTLDRLFHDPRAAAGFLFGTAALLLLGDRARRRAAAKAEPAGEASGPELTVLSAFVIGCAQALAILPGISRSGSTIAVGMMLGLAPARAARISFLLSIPAIAGAAVLKLPDLADATGGPSTGALVWAVLLAALVGWFALRFLLSFLGRGAFAWFALYCAAVGSTALFLL